MQSIKAICDHFQKTVPVLPTITAEIRMITARTIEKSVSAHIQETIHHIYDLVCQDNHYMKLHVCGMENLRMKDMVTLPVQAINWEDQSLIHVSLLIHSLITALQQYPPSLHARPQTDALSRG